MTLSIDTASLAALLGGPLSPQAEAVAKQNKAAASSQGVENWKVPALEEGFQLEPALQRTFVQVEGFMNRLLQPDGMAVSVDVAKDVDFKSQQEVAIGQVQDAYDGRVLKTYQGLDMLRLYAHNVRPKGIVVDGAL